MANLDIIRGRQVVIPLTNKSGGGVIAGDVVIVDTSNNASFTTTTSASYAGQIGIAQETIANATSGRILISGYAPLVNVNASQSRGNYLFTHTVAKQASGSATVAVGAFGYVLTSGTTPDAIIFGLTFQAGSGTVTSVAMTVPSILSVAGSPITTTGTLAVSLANESANLVFAGPASGGATTPTFRAIVRADIPAVPYVRVYNSTNQSIPNATGTNLTFDSELEDNFGFHAASPNPDRLTVPSGCAGVYVCNVAAAFAFNTTGERLFSLGTSSGGGITFAMDRAKANTITNGQTAFSVCGVYRFAVGDYLTANVYQDSTGSLNIERIANWSAELSMCWLGP